MHETPGRNVAKSLSIFSEGELTFTFTMLSAVPLSVVYLSVCRL